MTERLKQSRAEGEAHVRISLLEGMEANAWRIVKVWQTAEVSAHKELAEITEQARLAVEAREAAEARVAIAAAPPAVPEDTIPDEATSGSPVEGGPEDTIPDEATSLSIEEGWETEILEESQLPSVSTWPRPKGVTREAVLEQLPRSNHSAPPEHAVVHRWGAQTAEMDQPATRLPEIHQDDGGKVSL